MRIGWNDLRSRMTLMFVGLPLLVQVATLSPAESIPFAEQTGFIRQMTQYLLQHAIRQGAAWACAGLEVALAVNISARDLEDRAFAQRIARWLAAEGLPPGLPCLEVPETALMEEPEHAVELLREVRGIGVEVAIDDYGSGFSSLAYLKTLWVHELKIDRAFIDAMQDSARDATIVRSTIELGHSLGLKVTAEGVENERQVALLR
ncbi:MAG: EAL domain-containing protein [Burkholderiales bacterium]|nr:MAG: EAL domain-containing protein [Burkholderiales bacterium]